MEIPTQNPQNSSLLTIEEMGRALQVPISTLYHWVHRREIPFIKLGRHLRFDQTAVLSHFKERTEDRHQTCSTVDSLVNLSRNNGRRKPLRRSLKNRDWNLAYSEKE